jgi:hypothetical protein
LFSLVHKEKLVIRSHVYLDLVFLTIYESRLL